MSLNKIVLLCVLLFLTPISLAIIIGGNIYSGSIIPIAAKNASFLEIISIWLSWLVLVAIPVSALVLIVISLFKDKRDK